jgi:hypothetical protein
MQIACWKSAPALAAGNAFILKPSEMTPLVAHKVADILSEAGLPDGLFQIVHGTHEIGQAVCEQPGIAKVSLTGGVATGKLIMSQSASTLKKSRLSLAANHRFWCLMIVILSWRFKPLLMPISIPPAKYVQTKRGYLCSVRLPINLSLPWLIKPNPWLLTTLWRPMSIWAR